MTFQDKLFKLANDLLASTTQGIIKWTETAEEDSFRAVLRTGLVRIERLPPRRYSAEYLKKYATVSEFQGAPIDGYEYSLLVLDDKNKEIGRYFADNLERAQLLCELWHLASRSARNAEQKIDSLLEEVATKVRA